MCVCVSRNIVAQRLWTVDAAVRSSEFLLCCAGIGGRLLGGGAVIKVLHHYDQLPR